MDYTKIYKIKHLLIAFLILLLSTNADAVEWKNFSSFEEVQSLKVIDDSLYISTSGGLIRVASFVDTPQSYHKLDGLGTNNITDIIKDSNGDKWLTGFGRLIKWSDNTFEQFLFFDNLNNNLFQLNTLLEQGDYLWVATSIGLVLFSKVNDGGQIEDSYPLFGDLNPNPSVNDILVDRNIIWLATSDGVAFADFTNFSLLKSPSNWTTISTRNFAEIDNNEFLSIVFYNSSIYALNRTSLYRVDVDVFDFVTLTEIVLPVAATLQNMTIKNDTLIVLAEKNNVGTMYYLLSDTLNQTISLGNINPTDAVTFDGLLWVGSEKDGLETISNSTIAKFELGGLPDNVVSDIVVDKDERIFGGFSDKTFAASTGSNWENFNFPVGQDATVTMLDSLGRVWMGTWGKGVWVLDDTVIINYDENNSSLRGNSDNGATGLGWVYTTGMDNNGRFLFMTSYRAVNNYPIAIGDIENLNSPTGWDSIGTVNGLTNQFLTSLDYQAGKVAVGTESDGIFECSVGSNPFVSDKICRHLTRENSNLISNTVRDIAYAPNDELWVGTNFGLSRYDLGIDFFRDIQMPRGISSDINALEFDSRGNLWIGTQDGLALRNPNDGSYEVFTTFNSGLVSDFIQNITFDKLTGKIYVATDKGISVISSLQGKPVFEISEVLAFPNPFVINSPSDKLNFNFALTTDVSIYNASGEHIITMSVIDSWDGKNDKGNDVASGVYLFIVKDEDGNIGKGKILLVRN